MTRDEILALEPGPKLDRLVAEHLGLPVEHSIEECEDPFYSYCRNCGTSGSDSRIWNGPGWGSVPCEPAPYSTRIQDAWEVVERMRSKGLHGEFSTSAISATSSAAFGRDFRLLESVSGQVTEDGTGSMPHAICLAALLAVLTPGGYCIQCGRYCPPPGRCLVCDPITEASE